MKFTAICTRTRLTFVFTCCLPIHYLYTKISSFTPFIYIRIVLSFFYLLIQFSILRNSQLESDVCRLPEVSPLTQFPLVNTFAANDSQL